jgi:hypothetical protein
MHLDPLKRRYRNWRRSRKRSRPDALPDPFYHGADIRAVREFFLHHEPDAEGLADGGHSLSGECFVCNEVVDFRVARPAGGGPVNWRETLACPGCGLINRWRGCIHLFEAICQPTNEDRIYLTETLSPVYQHLVARYPMLIGSEYLPHAAPGELVELHAQQVRAEDVTRLSFDDHSLEAVLCFDVLEHVPDYLQALSEFHRVLAAGGQLLVSVPFSFHQQTTVRAVVNGAGLTEHLVPPCYHGDPLSAEGVLSYYDFGMDLVEELRRAGFSEAFLVCYRSLHWGYLQNNVAFVARKA